MMIANMNRTANKFQQKIRVALPVLAVLCPLVLSPAYAASKLARIEFKPSSTVTDIQLHSDSILPYHIAHTSDNKLMIDIDNVSSEGTIDTRFLGTSEISTISNVVIQPLNNHSLRLIVRGDHLAPPHVAFIPTRNEQPASAATTAASATAPLMQDSLGAKKATPKAAPAPIVHQAPPKASLNQSGIAQDGDILTPSAQADVKRPMSQPTEDPLSAMGGIINMILTYAPFGIVGLLLLGLGIFVAKKIGQMRQQPADNQFEFLLNQQANGKAVGFRQLAEAYDHSDAKAEPQKQSHTFPWQKQQEVHSEDLIGLGRLNHAPEAPAQPSLQEQLQHQATALPKAQPAAAPKAPTRQAAAQYAQNQRQAVAGKPKNQAPAAQQQRKRQLGDEHLRQELNRANEARQETKQLLRKEQQAVVAGNVKAGSNLKQSPLHRQAMQQRQAARQDQAPLSGNPEVLNFLRDVADLMDKDGRPAMANSFRKGINS